jgi:hypothetical protein
VRVRRPQRRGSLRRDSAAAASLQAAEVALRGAQERRGVALCGHFPPAGGRRAVVVVGRLLVVVLVGDLPRLRLQHPLRHHVAQEGDLPQPGREAVEVERARLARHAHLLGRQAVPHTTELHLAQPDAQPVDEHRRKLFELDLVGRRLDLRQLIERFPDSLHVALDRHDPPSERGTVLGDGRLDPALLPHHRLQASFGCAHELGSGDNVALGRRAAWSGCGGCCGSGLATSRDIG